MSPEKHLNEFELLVMLALIRLGDHAYGDPIAKEIEASSRRKVKVSNVYGTLQRLEEKELIAPSLGEPVSERDVRARRFQVTPKGLREVRKLLAAGSLKQFRS